MGKLLEKLSEIKIGFGGAAISGEGGGYGFGSISEQESLYLLQASYDSGIRIFDSAPIYGFGVSERRIGKAFSKIRDKVFIITKSGVTWSENLRVNMSNDPKIATKMLEQSLRDLNSSYIDLYMIHWPDPKVDIRRPMEVLARAKHQGKIKHIGLCNTNQVDLQKAMEVEKVEVIQSQLNLFTQESIEGLSDMLTDHGISFMSWGSLDKGILSGRVTKNRTFERPDARSFAPWWNKAQNLQKIDKVEKLKLFGDEVGHSLLELSIGHNLSNPLVSNVLCGIRNLNQLETILKAMENLPNKEIIDKALEVVSE